MARRGKYGAEKRIKELKKKKKREEKLEKKRQKKLEEVGGEPEQNGEGHPENGDDVVESDAAPGYGGSAASGSDTNDGSVVSPDDDTGKVESR